MVISVISPEKQLPGNMLATDDKNKVCMLACQWGHRWHVCLLSGNLGKTIREASIPCSLEPKGPWALSAKVQSKQMSRRHGHLRLKLLKLSVAGSSKSVGKCGNQAWAQNTTFKSLGSAPTTRPMAVRGRTQIGSDLYLGWRERSECLLLKRNYTESA